MVYGVGLHGFAKALVQLVLVNYLLVGFIIASVVWWCANRWLRHRNVHAADQQVEWMYAVDVHCNGFFVLFVLAYVLQFFFLPVLMRTSWISLFLGNTLFALSGAAYIYITYLGLNALPFLHHQQALLYCVPILVIIYLVSLLNGFNLSHHLIDYYF